MMRKIEMTVKSCFDCPFCPQDSEYGFGCNHPEIDPNWKKWYYRHNFGQGMDELYPNCPLDEVE
jgi:hypothetical protein